MAEPFGGTVAVDGLRELQRLFKLADTETRKEVRQIEREIAEPVKTGTETLAVATIPRIGGQWWRMRIGVTQNLIYVAPVKRGTKNQVRARPKFDTLLYGRAMGPTADRYAPEFPRRVEAALDKIARRWGSL